ncbi:hypothetical protein SD80_006380 [Scytonema tolypothrichoides VB-61278]|nr:hypothetical protein SD80_006380 [Scytonema tolypothrichoides VB-61278]
MPFQKNHKFGAKKKLLRPLDKEVIAFRGYEGQKNKLRSVPDWQERLREFVDDLIGEEPTQKQER